MSQDQNDDDAERSSLVASERAVATSTPQASPRRGRDTMSSSPQKEHFQGCLKLYAENVSDKGFERDNAFMKLNKTEIIQAWILVTKLLLQKVLI